MSRCEAPERRCDPACLLTPALEIAIAAGCRILEFYEAGFSVAQKSDQTPLTEADLAAHQLIVSGLQDLTPALPVLSEESTTIPLSDRCDWERYWLVDPLDGTREFIDRTDEFTVNIALIEDQQPVVGIIYAPALGLYYYAARGEGAWKREATNQPQPIQCRRWDGGRVTVAGSRSRHGPALQRYLNNLHDYELVILGSALKSCLVAEGGADLYARLGPTSEWDTAAAQCLLEEAGGRLTDTRMRPLRYNQRPTLLNPHFFASGAGETDWARYL